MDYSSSPLGCARRNPPDVACLRDAKCLVEDERLRRCVISGGSATSLEVGTDGFLYLIVRCYYNSTV